MDYFLCQGRRAQQISFPLGGIGTGYIGLAGNGRLLDWEIFNPPSKGSVNFNVNGGALYSTCFHKI